MKKSDWNSLKELRDNCLPWKQSKPPRLYLAQNYSPRRLLKENHNYKCNSRDQITNKQGYWKKNSNHLINKKNKELMINY